MYIPSLFEQLKTIQSRTLESYDVYFLNFVTCITNSILIPFNFAGITSEKPNLREWPGKSSLKICYQLTWVPKGNLVLDIALEELVCR